MTRFIVVAPNWLGDAVMALPAMADLKRHFQGAQLIVAARAPVAPLYALSPSVDAVVPLQWRGAPTRRRAMQADVERLRAIGGDVAVLFPNSFASAWLVRSVGIGERWGYASDWRRPLLTRGVRRPRRSMHQAVYYQTLIREFTQRCTDVLEMYVRRHPHLWLWMHRRWRERDPALAGALSLDEAEADA